MDQRELVEGLIAGRDDAWRHFLERHGRLIYAAGVRIGLDPGEREELFQEVVVSVLQSIGTLRDPAKLTSWTYSIAFRVAAGRMRRMRPTLSTDDPNVAARASALRDHSPTAEESLHRLNEVAALNDALESIGDRCRLLLSALYLEEPRPSYEEIGQRFDMPIGSIGPTRARCLAKLRTLLGGVSSADPPATTRRAGKESQTRRRPRSSATPRE